LTGVHATAGGLTSMIT